MSPIPLSTLSLFLSTVNLSVFFNHCLYCLSFFLLKWMQRSWSYQKGVLWSWSDVKLWQRTLWQTKYAASANQKMVLCAKVHFQELWGTINQHNVNNYAVHCPRAGSVWNIWGQCVEKQRKQVRKWGLRRQQYYFHIIVYYRSL